MGFAYSIINISITRLWQSGMVQHNDALFNPALHDQLSRDPGCRAGGKTAFFYGIRF